MISKSVEETIQIAKSFLDKILKNNKEQKGALIVALSGDLGAGKTAFTQAIGKHLGIKSKITSPTFVIIKKYTLPNPPFAGRGEFFSPCEGGVPKGRGGLNINFYFTLTLTA